MCVMVATVAGIPHSSSELEKLLRQLEGSDDHYHGDRDLRDVSMISLNLELNYIFQVINDLINIYAIPVWEIMCLKHLSIMIIVCLNSHHYCFLY